MLAKTEGGDTPFHHDGGLEIYEGAFPLRYSALAEFQKFVARTYRLSLPRALLCHGLKPGRHHPSFPGQGAEQKKTGGKSELGHLDSRPLLGRATISNAVGDKHGAVLGRFDLLQQNAIVLIVFLLKISAPLDHELHGGFTSGKHGELRGVDAKAQLFQ